MILFSLLYGITAALAALFLSTIAAQPLTAAAIGTLLIAACIEECCKLAAIVAGSARHHGTRILHAIGVGGGFALTEAVVTLSAQHSTTALLAIVPPALLHIALAVSAALTYYSIPGTRLTRTITTLIVAVLLHTAYNMLTPYPHIATLYTLAYITCALGLAFIMRRSA